MIKKFHFTKEISILPTLLALIGIGITVYQYISQSKYNNESRTSWIGVRVDPNFGSKVKIILGKENSDAYIYRKKAKFILSNNGYHTASIVSWSLYSPLDTEKDGTKITLKVYIPGMEPVLKAVNGKTIPIDIEPGSSKSIIIEYSVGISKKQYQYLPNKYKNGHEVHWRDIDNTLYNFTPYDTSSYYLLELVKNDGEVIALRFSNYGVNGFMQGERRPDMKQYVR